MSEPPSELLAEEPEVRFNPRRKLAIILAIAGVVLLPPLWWRNVSTWFDPVPGDLGWAGPIGWLDYAYAAMLMVEVGLLPLCMGVWWLAGRPRIRVAADRVLRVGWAPVMVFVWWQVLTLGPFVQITSWAPDAISADLWWWVLQSLTLAGLHLWLLGDFRRYLRGGVRLWAIVAAVGSIGIATGFSLAFWSVISLGWLPAEGLDSGALQTSDSLIVMGVDAFVSVVAAPVVEEIAFRGLLLSGLRAVIGDARWALLLSSLLFGVVHSYGPEGTVVVFVQGLVFGWLYLRTGSLVAPITCHAGGNILAVTYSVLARIAG